MLWKVNRSVVVTCITGQSITLLAKEREKLVFITSVYAKCLYMDRRRL